MRITSRTSDERGIALITALLAVLLASALMAGMFAALTADQRSHAVDRDQSQAYAAAHAGLEKLTSSLAQLFATDFSPSAAQIDVTDNTPPVIPGFSYTAPGGAAGSGYAVSFTPDVNGNPASNPNADITTGPFIGFKGLITPYTLTVTARSGGGSEVRLRREVQTVAVPVFQFGIFGEKSLSFHAGANFDFGGRVHTNDSLFLAQGTGSTLTFRDKLTAFTEVVRSQLENTTPITDSNHTGTVRILTQLNSANFRNLLSTEGSVKFGPTSAKVAGWKSLSENDYHTIIRNRLTGAKRLDLPLVSQGATPIDLIRRPVVGSNENVVNNPVFLQRYFAQASLRILLSDRAADITGLPTITGGAPIQLDGNWNNPADPNLPAGYVVAAGARTPLARSPGPEDRLTAAGSAYAAGTQHTLRVNAIPSAMQLPAAGLQINATAGIVCQGKTLTWFLGCNTLPMPGNIIAGSPVTVALPLGGTATTTTVNGPYARQAAVDIRVVSTQTFTHDFAWISNGARFTPMSCEGYTLVVPATPTLTMCRIPGVAAAVPTNRTITTAFLSPAPTSLLGGFIKIEKQDAGGIWTDVTAEILALGFAAPNQEGTACGDPTPTAVIRLQRLRDNGGACGYANSIDSRDYWPNALYDAREGVARDVLTTANMTMGGVMNYVTIDVGNLARWFSGAIGVTGATAFNNNGYIVYFSDRRGNHNGAVVGAPETAEFGFEDSINQATAAGAVNGVLELGEDRNEDTLLQNYGALPSAIGLPAGALLAPFDAAATPWTQIGNHPAVAIANHPAARVNRQVLFRRALKLTNAGIAAGVNSLPVSGLTIAAENAVYVQGNYNATSADVEAEPNRPAAIMGDAITILSTSWNDANSFNFPNDMTNRNAVTTGYRFALIAGKSLAFQNPAWTGVGDFGTDGGVHNFMRMLEDWGGQAINYRGSIVSLYTARQAIGIYRANSNVYNPGTRNFAFDEDFLTPALLPPGTPMFRDINTLKFRQILRPNQ